MQVVRVYVEFPTPQYVLDVYETANGPYRFHINVIEWPSNLLGPAGGVLVSEFQQW